MEKRIDWIDCAKGFGILCVIMGHTPMTPQINAFIYTFHMPLFFFLSGYFLLQKERSFKDELIRKAKTLLLPYVIFTFVSYFFFHILPQILGMECKHEIYDFNTVIKGLATGDRSVAGFWFLPCLFFGEMIIIALNKLDVFKKKYWAYWLLVFAGIGYGINLIYPDALPMSVDLIFIGACFITGGMLYRNIDTKKIPVIASMGIFLLFALFAYLNYRETDGLGTDMYNNQFGNMLFFYLTAFLAIVFIINMLSRLKPIKPFLFLGKNSLLIYCTHLILINILVRTLRYCGIGTDGSPLYTLAISLLITLGVCLISIPVAYLVNNYLPFLLGKKRTPKQIEK